jgi:hypothetical protein
MKVKIIFEVLFLSVIFSKVVLADSASYVYTPNGSAVSTMTMTYELSAAEINFKIALVQQDFPNATILAYPSRKYNWSFLCLYDGSQQAMIVDEYVQETNT